MPKRPTGTGARAAPPHLVPAIPPTHQDYAVLRPIVDALLTAAGGQSTLEKLMAGIVRDCIDRVIQTPKTGRRLYTDLQNSEKTYIGTAVEIDLRSALGLSRGADMDLEIAGHDVDVKFSQGKGWMIPPEAIGKPCILISANDLTSRYSLGVIVAREDYLNPGANRDAKKTVRAEHRVNIWWLVQGGSYPTNFWLTVPQDIIDRISDGRSGNQRMMTLFRELRDRPISRKVVEDVATQLDPTRRVRADRSRGTRNLLEQEGILVLSGSKPEHRQLVAELGLPPVVRTEYISHRFQTSAERRIASKYGLTI
jgi:hypothetical protein